MLGRFASLVELSFGWRENPRMNALTEPTILETLVTAAWVPSPLGTTYLDAGGDIHDIAIGVPQKQTLLNPARV